MTAITGVRSASNYHVVETKEDDRRSREAAMYSDNYRLVVAVLHKCVPASEPYRKNKIDLVFEIAGRLDEQRNFPVASLCYPTAMCLSQYMFQYPRCFQSMNIVSEWNTFAESEAGENLTAKYDPRKLRVPVEKLPHDNMRGQHCGETEESGDNIRPLARVGTWESGRQIHP